MHKSSKYLILGGQVLTLHYLALLSASRVSDGESILLWSSSISNSDCFKGSRAQRVLFRVARYLLLHQCHGQTRNSSTHAKMTRETMRSPKHSIALNFKSSQAHSGERDDWFSKQHHAYHVLECVKDDPQNCETLTYELLFVVMCKSAPTYPNEDGKTD